VASIGIHAAFPESSSGDDLYRRRKKADLEVRSRIPPRASCAMVAHGSDGRVDSGRRIGDSGCRDANRFPCCWRRTALSGLVPFSLDELDVIGDLFAGALRRARRAEITIADEGGRAIAVMRGLNARALPALRTHSPSTSRFGT